MVRCALMKATVHGLRSVPRSIKAVIGDLVYNPTRSRASNDMEPPDFPLSPMSRRLNRECMPLHKPGAATSTTWHSKLQPCEWLRIMWMMWLPCSKGFRRMKLCAPRFGCLVQKGFRRMNLCVPRFSCLVQKALGAWNCVRLGLAALFRL